MARVWAGSAFLLMVLGVSAAVWWLSLSAALDRLEIRARSELALTAGRLVTSLQQYRETAVLMAEHPVVLALAETGVEGAARDGAADALMRRVADKTGAASLRVVAEDGRLLAASGDDAAAGDVPRAVLSRAMEGALGRHHSAEPERRYIFAAPVFGRTGRAVAAVVVDVDMWTLEAVWRGAPETVFFTDAAGVVFITNRSELLYRRRPLVDPVPGAAFGYRPETLAPFPDLTSVRRFAHEIWRIDAGRFVPGRALHLTLPLPVVGLTGELLADAAPAWRHAWMQALAAAALGLALGAALVVAAERRRRLSDRLSIEAAATARLEAEVAERTRALSDANAVLRHEIAEREEAEARLTRAQADLVQAGKLSALGQMSAGISHELNQPLMAIRSFAENAQTFIDRGRPEVAAQNLGRISEMARRMGRIIKNLRAFARQESEAISDVDLGAVVEAVLEMVEVRARNAGATLDWRPPPGPVMVRGGEVRLSQVLLNLVSNALDATEGRDAPRVELSLHPGAPVRLVVRDNGPGIAAPDRIFDPFYSTKEVGRSEGMGLGLSISYGLVKSFGGKIRGDNAAGGGAVFTVELLPASARAAA